MSISETIAKYRKQKGYTQEQLGEMLGVTNQAVSKWESAVSMPDVMLLPKIANVLGITLNDLYGIGHEAQEGKDMNHKIDEFASETQNLIKTHMYKQLFVETETLKEMVNFEHNAKDVTKINSAYTLGIFSCISNGAAFVSDNLSVVSSNFEIRNNAKIFDDKSIVSGMKKLCDSNVRKVLSYMYSESFRDTPGEHLFYKENNLHDQEFSPDEISIACHLSEDETLEAIEKLVAIHIVGVSNENHQTRYVFMKTKGIETAIVFRVIERLVKESFSWGCGYRVGHIAE